VRDFVRKLNFGFRLGWPMAKLPVRDERSSAIPQTLVIAPADESSVIGRDIREAIALIVTLVNPRGSLRRAEGRN